MVWWFGGGGGGVKHLDWLDPWLYRKSHVIKSAVGAGTGYQVRVEVYKKDILPKSFTFQNRFNDICPVSTRPHAQGAVCDGTYVYCTCDHTLKKYERDGTLVDTKTDPHLEGTDMEQVNHLFIYGDYLYIGSNNFDKTPEKGYIKIFKKSDLSYVEEHQVKDYYCEGCCFHDGAWWVVYWDWAYVSKYDLDWNHIADYALEDPELKTQGAIWIGDYFYRPTCDECQIYKWNGSGFTKIKSLATPFDPETTCAQGIGKDPTRNEMWWGEITTAYHSNVVQSTIDYGDEQVSCEGHCGDDFGDIRFTGGDGTTLLDYWMEKKVDGEYAIFWVEVQGDLGSDQTIYLYYGKSGETTISDIEDTFLFGDDFPGDALDSSKWDYDGWGTFNGISGYYSVASGMLRVWGDDTNFRILVAKYTISPSDKIAILTRTKRAGTVCGPHYSMFDGSEVDGYSNRVCVVDLGKDGDWDVGNKVDGVDDVIENVAIFSADVWYKPELRRKSTSICGASIMDDGYSSLYSNEWDKGAWNVIMRPNFWFKYNVNKWLDFVVIRKYVDPEPSHGAWGSEETP